jgi:hypothetical protein
MATVRVAHAEPLPGRLPNGDFLTGGHLVVLADDVGHRAVPIWVRGGTDPGVDDLARLVELRDRPPEATVSVAVPEELATRLLAVAGASVTGVDIDVTQADAGPLGPEVSVARVELTGRSGIRHVAAGLGLGLAIAVTAGAPIRMPDAVMGRLGAPVAGDDLLTPFLDRVPPAVRERSMPGKRPRYEPRNLDFADGLDRWNLAVDLGEWTLTVPEGYVVGVEGRSAILSSAAAQPAGSALLLQAIYAEDYRGGAVTFGGEIRTDDRTERAGLRLLVIRHQPRGGPVREDGGATVFGPTSWTGHEITALVPDDANMILFGIELTGPGLVALRNPTLSQAPTP